MVVEMMTLIDVCCCFPTKKTDFFCVERAGGKTKPFMIKSEKGKIRSIIQT